METTTTPQNETGSMKRFVITFGLIAGGLLGIFMFGGYFAFKDSAGYGGSEIIGYITMVIAMSAIFVGIKQYRDKELGGIISFGKAFKAGLLMFLISAVIYVLSWELLILTVPDLLKDFSEMAAAEGQGGDPEFMELYTNNVFVRMPITFLEVLFPGLIITLISAAILKKK